MKVLKNHTDSSQFFPQFFKHVDKCDCRVCELDLWKPRRLPAPIFEAVHTSLPCPCQYIPQPQPDAATLGSKEFHFMILEEAFQHAAPTAEAAPATQPWAASGKALSSRVQIQPNKKGLSIAHSSTVRDVVICQEAGCGKPRCIFSQPLSKSTPAISPMLLPSLTRGRASLDSEGALSGADSARIAQQGADEPSPDNIASV
eukprot:jgi/Tetstr1/435527/TSEL_024431.t1